MKKILLFIFSFFVFLNVVNAGGYIVYDIDSGSIIKASNENEKHLIASTSKIMTAIIAIEENNLEEIITVDKNILSAVGSSIYLEIGEKISLKDLIYGMMLRSGNDAATMIAINNSGSMESFAKKMNDYAVKIGMKNTSFINAHGLEGKDGNGNISTSFDMALLTSYAMKNETFKSIFKTQNYSCKSDKKSYVWFNKNKLLKYDYVTGGKTGYTKKAKRTLVTTGLVNGTNIVVVTLNDPNDWQTHLSSYDYVKKNYINVPVLDKDKFKININNIFIEDKLLIKNNYNKLVRNSEIKYFKIKYLLSSKDNYKNNDIVGQANIYFKDDLVHTENIYIQKNNKKSRKNFFKRLFKL